MTYVAIQLRDWLKELFLEIDNLKEQKRQSTPTKKYLHDIETRERFEYVTVIICK